MKIFLKIALVVIISISLGKDLFAMDKQLSFSSEELQRKAPKNQYIDFATFVDYHQKITKKFSSIDERTKSGDDSLLESINTEKARIDYLLERIENLDRNLESAKEEILKLKSSQQEILEASTFNLNTHRDSFEEQIKDHKKVLSDVQKNINNVSRLQKSVGIITFGGFLGFAIFKILMGKK